MNENLADKFYSFFWKDELCRIFFLHHKSELLSVNTLDIGITQKDYYSPKIVLSSAIERKKAVGNHTITIRSESKNFDTLKNIQTNITKYFNENLFQEYIENKFPNTVIKVKEELEDGEWLKLVMNILSSFSSEKSFIKLLHQYYVIPRNIETASDLEQYLFDEVKKEGLEFLKRNKITELLFSIDEIGKYYDLLLREKLLKGNLHIGDLLRDTNNYKSLTVLFDTLYELGVLIGARYKTYYECVTCPQDTFTGMITTNFLPSSAKKIKCPRCNNSTFYLIPYHLHDTIFEDVTSPDGLLHSAMQYLFKTQGKYFNANVIINGEELDFCIFNENHQIIQTIEVKMFKVLQNNNTKLGNIAQSIGKVKKRREKLIEIDTNFGEIENIIVTNYNSKELLKEARSEYKSDLDKHKIRLITVEDLIHE